MLAEIANISADAFVTKLKAGTTFEFREGSRITGTGKIIKILNKALLEI